MFVFIETLFLRVVTRPLNCLIESIVRKGRLWGIWCKGVLPSSAQ